MSQVIAKAWYSNADVLTTDKLNELKGQIDCDYPDMVCIAEVKPKNFIGNLSFVEYYINSYNLETITILDDEGRSMLLYIKKYISVSFTRSVFIYKHIDPKINNL